MSAGTTPHRIVSMIAALELPLVLAVAPVLLFADTWLVPAVLMVCGVSCCARAAGTTLVPDTPLNIPLYGLIAMMAVSWGVTVDRELTLAKIAGLTSGLLLFWAVTRWVDRPSRLQWLLFGTVLMGGALAVAGLFGTQAPAKFPAIAAIAASLPTLIRGVPGAVDGFNPNAVAGALVLLLPLQVIRVCRYLRAPRTGTVWGVAAFVVEALCLGAAALALLVTQSRGAWLGAVIAACCVAAAVHRRGRYVIAAVSVVGAVWVAWGPDQVSQGAAALGDSGFEATVSTRMELWSRALDAIQDFPFTGVGMNGFRTIMPVLYPTFLAPADPSIAHAHNIALQAALDLGLPGLVAYTAVWVMALMLVWRAWRRGRADWNWQALALGAGLVAHLTFGVTDVIALGTKVGVVFWVVMASVVCLDRATAAAPGN